MNINFSPADEGFIKRKVDDGFYSNATELVRDAVRRLREVEDRRMELLAAIQLGEDSIARSGSKPYTPELLEAITKRALERAQKGEEPRPDVTP